MSVVNCKVANIRPRYTTLREWVADPNNVYVGRAGVVFVDKVRFPKEASKFCNPFKVGKDGTREEVISKFREHMAAKLKGDPELVKELVAMKGKNLGCWCAPEPCHADVLLDLIKQYSQ